MTRAKDIMQTRVISVGRDDPLMSVHRLFCDEDISGAPVVDDAGEVLGVVTMRDLLRESREEHDMPDRELAYFRDDSSGTPRESFGEGNWGADELMSRTAGDVMSPEVISVTPEAKVAEVVEKVLVNKIHRVLVIERTESGGSLVGMISLFDLVQLLA